MFRKILIANRGEIAVRIIRACRELNISPVAVFSEADAGALHVRLADEAYEIGPAPSVESYLRIERIIEAALEVAARKRFIRATVFWPRTRVRAGGRGRRPRLHWAERRSDALMGAKTSARRVAVAAGVPVVPGTTEPLSSLEEAREVAARFGYPVMLKASAGGGGKGMRLVRADEELPIGFRDGAIGGGRGLRRPEVYLEKAIERPRHIEIQIFADNHGNCRSSGRARVLHPAPPPESDRGMPVAD